MSKRMKHFQSIGLGAIAACIVAAGLGWSMELWGMAGDPYGMIRYAVRLVVVVPLATVLAIGATRAFNRFTPGQWMPEEWENEIARALVLGTLIIGVFWLCVQG